MILFIIFHPKDKRETCMYGTYLAYLAVSWSIYFYSIRVSLVLMTLLIFGVLLSV
jgi:hypothetical protein